MENKPNFNKDYFAVTILRAFTTVYLHNHNVSDAHYMLLNKLNNSNTPETREKRRIINKCRDLFMKIEDPDTKKEKAPPVDSVISAYRAESNANIGRNPTDSEIAKKLLECFSDELWSDNKRSYNMSQIASRGMVSVRTTPEGSLEKDVWYESFEEEQKKLGNNNKDKLPPSITLRNIRGNSIIIEYMGTLHYSTQSADEYIYKHRIYKSIDDSENSYKVYEKFSNIDINALEENPELRKVVFSELLSTNNLEHSYADDYIGEINSPKLSSKPLKPGEEITLPGYYKYQITPNYALIYDGERIEAIRAYNQQEAQKTKRQSQEQSKSDSEPEL